MGKHYIRRGEWYHYCRRVPEYLSEYDSRKHVRISLKTKDEKEARRRASVYDDFVEEYWGELVRTGRKDHGLGQFERVRALAKAHGFAYKTVAQVAEGPIDELLDRVEAAALASKADRNAFLGGARVDSGLLLSESMDRYWPLCADRLTDKSPNQIRKFKNPRNAAIINFIAAVGDIDLGRVERTHVLRFRQWLMERIASGEIVGHTANRQLQHVKDVLHTVALDAQIELRVNSLFADTRFNDDKKVRPSFEADYVQKTLLDGRSLKGLNDDARMLVYMMAETGARESEIIGLTGDDFVLENEVPYIWVRPNALRSLKTKKSERKIPLVGVALSAARRIAPDGLTRYQAVPDSASGAVNKYLRENGLKPTKGHTLYSLRHTFKDRLRDAGAPEEVIDELMGHRTAGPKYGRGHLMEAKHRWLQQIAFTAPPKL